MLSSCWFLRSDGRVSVCFSSKQQSQALTNSLESLEKREEVLQDKLGSLENRHLQDAGRLKTQLDQAQERTHTLQREVSIRQKTLQRYSLVHFGEFPERRLLQNTKVFLFEENFLNRKLLQQTLNSSDAADSVCD